MNAIEAGRLAKAEGHELERDLPALMNEMFGGDHVTNGRPDTKVDIYDNETCLLYTSPRPRDGLLSRMPSSA